MSLKNSFSGPLLFSIYVYDISRDIESKIKIFADGCIIYRVIKNAADFNGLQSESAEIEDWCSMELNTKECKYA